MADNQITCRVCGIELPDLPASLSPEWQTAICPACGEVAVVCRCPVVCSECGIEYHCESAWLAEDIVVAKCPTCGSTAAIRRPEPPPPPSPPPPVVSEPPAAPAPVEASDDSAPDHPAPDWPAPPWPPTPRGPKIPENADARHAGAMVALAVAGFFVLACFLPTIRLGRGSNFEPGILCLLFGWLACYLWFPNPLMFCGCIALLAGRNRLAFVFGVLSCLCTVPLLFGSDKGQYDLSWGYYVWQCDIFLLTISSGILLRLYGARVAMPRR